MMEELIERPAAAGAIPSRRKLRNAPLTRDEIHSLNVRHDWHVVSFKTAEHRSVAKAAHQVEINARKTRVARRTTPVMENPVAVVHEHKRENARRMRQAA